MSKIRVFLDTNVILEAIRIKLWTTICDKYAIETVEKCIELIKLFRLGKLDEENLESNLYN